MYTLYLATQRLALTGHVKVWLAGRMRVALGSFLCDPRDRARWTTTIGEHNEKTFKKKKRQLVSRLP